jgi:hypothetical protein
MAHGDLKPMEAPGTDRLVTLTGVVALGAGGAISAAAGANDCEGFTVAKTGSEVGRYTVTLLNRFLKVQYAHCVVEGAADAAAAAAKGQVCQLRGVDAVGKTMFFQLLTPSLAAGASVDVEAEDNAKLRFVIICSRGKC